MKAADRSLHPVLDPCDVPRLYRTGIEQFNRREFFECHETLELIWREENRRHVRLFFQGLIQVAVGFLHLSAGNIRGARSLLRRGSEKLADFQPYHYGVRLDVFLPQVRACFREIERLGQDRLHEFPSSLLPTIELGDIDDLVAEWKR
jgi:predicted metal-dependent hydrolase